MKIVLHPARNRLIVIVMAFLTVSCAVVAAQDNPFIGMATRPYSSYCFELNRTVYMEICMQDSLWKAQVAAQMREAAEVTKNRKWSLEADFFELMYGHSQNVNLYKSDTMLLKRQAAIQILNLQQIIRQAQKIKAVDIELRAHFHLWGCYRYDIKNYEMAFRYCAELDRALTDVTAAQFPFRPFYYSETGTLYAEFEAYETARLFYEKGLENLTYTDELLTVRLLWNNLGLIYHNFYRDYEKSDSCFSGIFNTMPQNPLRPSSSQDPNTRFTQQDEYELWIAIAKGNLGSNRYLCGDYDEAIPLLIYSIEETTKNNPYNYSYAAGKALTLSEIYLIRQEAEPAKRYAAKAYGFLEKDRIQRAESEITNTYLLMQYYNVLSRCCRLSGDAFQALQYADSAAEARTRYDSEYDIRQLHLAEQRLRQEELRAEMQRSQTYRRNMMLTAVCALMFLLLLLAIFYLFRQKQAAYRALVIKTRQWAWAETETPPAYKASATASGKNRRKEERKEPDEIDRLNFDKLNRLITEKKIYLEQEITIEQVARMLDMGRTYLSNAINNCTGDSFTAIINEYRVKEAARLLSDPANNLFTIESLGLSSGFSDRSTFYRVFKKSAGVSPSTFRRKALEMGK